RGRGAGRARLWPAARALPVGAVSTMLRKLLGPLALALAAPGAASAHESAGFELDPARIDRTLAAMVREGRTVGASVLVWKDGKEAYFAAEGLADRAAARPFVRDTLVQIFSMTKPVTGVALMQLWEQGKFGLDDPLSD